MGCEEIRDLLALYAGGESYDHERAAVDAHLAACASCARELDRYRETRAGLAALRDEPLPAGTERRLWDGVRSGLFPARAPRRLPRGETALRFAAALLLGLAVGVATQFLMGTPVAASRNDGFVARELPAPRPVPVTTPGPSPFNVVPSTEPRPYLPRVEAIPAGGERDF